MTSTELLQDMSGQIIAVQRDGKVLFAGKFTLQGVGELLKPGDDILDEQGRVIKFTGPETFEDSTDTGPSSSDEKP